MTRRLAVTVVTAVLGLWACNPGSASSALIRLEAEMAGGRCAHGGVAVLTGLDKNQDGALGDDEVDAAQTRYVCNGAPGAAGESGGVGTQGDAGLNALSTVTAEAAGTNCRYGGVRIDVGVDLDADGTLDAAEITGTRYVCDRASTDAIYFGDLTIRDAADLALLDGIQVVAGTLRIVSTPTATLSLPDLRVVSGAFLVEAGDGGYRDAPASLSSISLPELRRASRFSLRGNDAITTLSLPKLERLDSLSVESNDELTQLSFPALASAGAVSLSYNPKLTSASLPALRWTNDLYVSGNTLLTTLSLGALRVAESYFYVGENPALSHCAVQRLLSGLDRRPSSWTDTPNNDSTPTCTLADACSTRTVPGISGTLRRCLAPATFAEATTHCATFGTGAALLWFTSTAEWAAMKAATVDGTFGWASWIGYSDAMVEGTWVAQSGFTGYSPTSEMNFWGFGEPSGGTTENAMELMSNGLVNDLPATELRAFICRVP